jgi:uncharacterized membrane protein (UPF0127 family)
MMFRRSLAPSDGLLLVGAGDSRIDASIHMLFVRFDLAVFWISSKMQIVDKILARSWRPVYIPHSPARYVLEIHSERIAEFDVDESVQFIPA